MLTNIVTLVIINNVIRNNLLQAIHRGVAPSQTPTPRTPGLLAQLEEHVSHKYTVTGSIPAQSTHITPEI